MMRIPLAIMCVACILACGATPTSPSDPPLSELSSAPTRIVVAGHTLTLTTFLSRDFMPIAPPDGQPLGGVLRIQTEDGSAVPADVSVDLGWVIRNSDVWSTAVEQRPRADTAPHYEVVVRGGPKWGPDITVTVVARVRDASGRAFLLRAPDQRIIGTW